MTGGPDRVVLVAAERLAGWLDRFAAAHGPLAVTAHETDVRLTAADGAVAVCTVPFPPLAVDEAAADRGLAGHACAERTVGVLLVRRGGHAVGVFRGATLLTSKVGARHVQGRTAAGGQSQQRFARRRENQAREAFAAAAEVAARVLLPYADRLDAVVTGGDRAAVRAALDDARLAPLRPLVTERFLDVPDPRQRVLLDTPRQFRAVPVVISDPPAG